MSSSKTKKGLLILILILFISNFILLFLSLKTFPSYGGFTRQILFIKPNSENHSGGYFIILDEVATQSESYEIESLLHTRGKIDISSDSQSFVTTVSSYISGKPISMKVSYLNEIQSLKEEEGYFLPTHYKENYPYDDIYAPYIKAKYQAVANPIMATMLYPKNDSDGEQSFPEIKSPNDGPVSIGEKDLLYYSEEITEKSFSDPDIRFQGELFFLRRNSTDDNKLDYVFIQNGNKLDYQSQDYFSSSYSLPYFLARYNNQTYISGLTKAFNTMESETEISLYCPFNATNLKIDGVNASFLQSENQITFKTSEGSHSFAITKNQNLESQEIDPLAEESLVRVLPRKNVWSCDSTLIEQLNHPSMLFNQSELISIRNKINDTNKIWNDWYNSYTSNVDQITIPEDYDKEYRFQNLYKLTLKYLIDGGDGYLTKAKSFMDNIGSIDHFSQDLRRSYSVQALAIAYDALYPHFSTNEKEKFADKLQFIAAPLMQMDLYPDNNHRVVDAGGLGLAGFALRNCSMINKAIKTILIYYYTQNPVDGGSYEGYSYNAYAMGEILSFVTSLRRLGGFNFFEDPQFVASLRFMGETLGPLGMPSLYEDCTFSSRIHEVLLIAAAQINHTNPQLAQNFQYLWEQRQNNSAYVGATNYGYIKGDSPSFEKIICYSVNQSINAKPFDYRKEIWKDSSMAFLRSHDEEDALFLSFSCKDYSQSHAHFDENSFEIWAYGAYIINNPGYPGWGLRHHDWTIQSEASNTLLIDGSGQRKSIADGLIASISSPYFSMIMGQANTIYNDHGAPEQALEFYLLFFLNFIFLGIAILLYSFLIRTPEKIEKNNELNKSEKQNPNEGEKEKNRADPKEDSEFTTLSNKINHSRIPNNKDLILASLFHPIKLQQMLKTKEDRKNAKFVTRFNKFLLIGLLALFYIFSIMDIFATTNYHAQYFEDKVGWVFDLLPIIEILLLLLGIVLIVLFVSLFMNLYYRLNYSLLMASKGEINSQLMKKTELNDEEELGWDKEWIKVNSSISLLPLVPVIIFASLITFFTVSQSIKLGISKIFTEFGSVNEIYHELILIMLEIVNNFYYILIFTIPFLLVMGWIFSNGLELFKKESNTSKKYALIPVISYFVLSVFFFLLFIAFFLGIMQIFSIISIEGAVQ